MNLLRSGLIYGTVAIGGSLLWRKLGFYDNDDVRKRSFNAGIRTSQKFKQYPAWDNIAEPFIVKQSTILFLAGHSFIEGMASDNEETTRIRKVLESMDTDIATEIKRKD